MWFHRSMSRGLGQRSFVGCVFLLILASANVLSAQCNEGGTITPTSVPNASVGVAYSVQLMETGVPMYSSVTWGPMGNLPPGLTLDTSSMTASTTISGTPTTVGTYTFTVAAEYNYSANYCSSQTYTIVVSGSATPLTITTGALPGATLNVPYSAQLEASGGSGAISWGIEMPSDRPGSAASATARAKNQKPAIKPFGGLQLPAGLSLSYSGLISGTPTALGQSQFTVYAEDQAMDIAYQPLGISVYPCVPTIGPAASTLPPGDVNTAYPQVQFNVSGCPGSTYTFSEQSANPFGPNTLVPGLTLSSSGVLRGTPSAVGMYSILVTVTDQNQNQTQSQYSITINALPTISTSSPLPNGPVGVPYSQQIAATGGVPPYIFSMNANPPGITITQSGVLNGTPTKGGTFNFNIAVTDSLGGQTVQPFQVTFATAVSQLQVAPLSLIFNANVNGSAPATQAISIAPANGATPPLNFRVLVNNGQSGTTAPSWITVTPTTGAVPAGIVVSVDQGAMPAGAYTAGIQILDSNGFPTEVAVTLNVTTTAQQFTVAPAILNFAARSSTPGTLVGTLAVSNTGPASLPFTTSVVGNSSWISSVTASSNTTARNAPVFVQVQVNTNGLAVGAYQDAILVSSSAGNVQVPVSLFVAASGPILAVDTTGVLFQALEGGGSTATQIVKIVNLGDPSSTVNWNATLVSGSNWLNLVSSSGTATSTAPGSLTLALAPNATQLTVDPYYAVIKIADSNSLNSPQYVTAVLNLQPSTTALEPGLTPAGLFFTTPAGGTAPAPQQVQINVSGASATTFDATASTFGTGTWLSVTPASGSASGQTSGSIAVSVNPTGLAAGIYSGNVSVSVGSLLQSVNVTFVVQPTSSTGSISQFRPEAAGCAASKLAVTETGLANNFAVPAGWPATLLVQLHDDCGGPVTNGSVVASFSNGDPALNFAGDSLGNYSTTWQPGVVNSQMVITLNATAGSLQSATAKLYGGIAQNQTPPPTLAAGGTLNNLNPVIGGPLAPGTIAQVYGAGLASTAVSPGVVPLPTMFNNTSALIGTTEAPLYFLSTGQINIQIPYETTATQQTPIILNVNNAYTVPLMLEIVPAAPGVLSALDGPTPPSVQNGAHIIAQHSADGSLVTSSSPAKPGEYLVMYLVGMGATNPPVASGAETPGTPLSTVTSQPTVTVGSQTSNVVFAGLTPFFVGLYQIDFQVPMGASSGELEVEVVQNGVAANPTLLPVSN